MASQLLNFKTKVERLAKAYTKLSIVLLRIEPPKRKGRWKTQVGFYTDQGREITSESFSCRVFDNDLLNLKISTKRIERHAEEGDGVGAQFWVVPESE